MSNRYKGSLLSTTIIAGLVAASPAFAQDAPVAASNTDTTAATQETPADSPAVTPEDEPEAIVVTGSRIVSPNITSLAPIQVVGETDIDQSGAINIQEVLLENPAFGTPGFSRTNTAFATSGAGVATVDLRDLGSDRTLVLINSRRVVAGLPGSASVDLNVIPTQFIERIDILTGGASSLYGSDAVAGVVNFLYKRNFSGVLLEGQYGLTGRGDSQRYQISATVGGNFADDRGNLMAHIGYTNEKGLFSRQRKNTRVDDITEITYSYDPDDYTVERSPFLSSFPPQGRFNAGAYNFTYSPDGVLQPCFTANGATCTSAIGNGVGPNGFNRQAFRTLAVPVERYLFAMRGHYDITDNISFVAEGTYSKTKSSSEIEPFPFDSGGTGGPYSSVGGRANIESQVLTAGGLVTRVNPFVPAAILAQATDSAFDLDTFRDISFAKRLSDLSTRNLSVDRDFYRFVVGLEGKLFDSKWNWDISYNYGETRESQTSNGQLNTQNFRNAFAAVQEDAGTGDLNGNSVIGDIVCADPIARGDGCVPINIFGFGSISPAAADYIRAETNHDTTIRQQVLAANLSGSLVDLPAGPLGVAIGAEYRKEFSAENWDALTNAGLNAGNILPDTTGKFNVKELFGELNIPIVKDKPFFHELTARVAGRLSDYSTVGSVKTWSAGGEWSPIEAIRFRGTYARSTRAPNIGELFQGPAQTFPTGLADPCVGVTLATTGTLADNCRAATGVLANIATNGGTFTINQADRQGISGFDSGTPTLGVERSRSITAGFVITPRNIPALRNFELSVDYYNIKVTDAIVAFPRQYTLNQCYQESDPFFCNLISRRATPSGSNSAGSLENINAPLVNGGALATKGIDFVARYRTSLDKWMTGLNMSARVSWTHLLDAYTIPLPGAEKDPFDGEIGTAKNRVTGTLAFNTPKVGLSFSGNYIGKSYEDNLYLERINAAREQFDVGPPLDKDDLATSAQFYLDAQLTFTPARQYELFLGVDNLLDNDAPILLSGTTYNITGADTAADVYDVFGRRFYAGVRLRF